MPLTAPEVCALQSCSSHSRHVCENMLRGVAVNGWHNTKTPLETALGPAWLACNTLELGLGP